MMEVQTAKIILFYYGLTIWQVRMIEYFFRMFLATDHKQQKVIFCGQTGSNFGRVASANPDLNTTETTVMGNE